MARYSPADASFSWAAALVPDVTIIGDFDKEAILEEITPIGVAWETHAKVGVSRLAPVTVEAPYSTTAGDLAVVADTATVGGTVAIIVTFGGSKTCSFSSVVKSIKRTIARGALDKTVVTLQPTGPITEA